MERKKNEAPVKTPAELWRATEYSLKGFKAAMGEKAFVTELVFAAFAFVVLPFLEVSRVEAAVMVLAALNILVCELVNTAIEVVIDRISPARHPLSGKAKDIGSAVVFVAIAAAVAVWAIILV